MPPTKRFTTKVVIPTTDLIVDIYRIEAERVGMSITNLMRNVLETGAKTIQSINKETITNDQPTQEPTSIAS